MKDSPLQPDDDGRVHWSAWLESERLQVTCYRAEDNGDRSEWSMYNRGRADALQAAIEDVTALLSNESSSPTAAGSNGGAQPKESNAK